MNVKNLAKLGKYLSSLPEDYQDFGMQYFVDGTSERQDDHAHIAKCGTAACAVGHGPRAGIKPKKGEDWMEYSSRAFGLNTELLHEMYLWEWMFGSDWSRVDDTPQGAARRIACVIDSSCTVHHYNPMQCVDSRYPDMLGSKQKMVAAKKKYDTIDLKDYEWPT